MEMIQRPCCGTKALLARFYEGAVRLPHKSGCRGVPSDFSYLRGAVDPKP